MSASARDSRCTSSTPTERPESIDLRSHDVRTEQTLTPTASFWLDNLDRLTQRFNTWVSR